jgi:hypothetical protein
VSALILGNTAARYVVDDDFPIGVDPAEADLAADMLEGA